MSDLLSSAEHIFALIAKIIYFAVILSTIIVVISENRNPVKTMAWVLILLFLPLVGLVLYFFFGRDTRKEKIISKRILNSLVKRPEADYLMPNASQQSDDNIRIMRFFSSTNQSLPFYNNSVKLYTDSYSMLSSLIKEIYSAKHHIHFQYYIFEDDAVGRLVRDALIDRASKGIEVRVIYDDVGCWNVPNAFFEKMRESGIETRSFLKVRFPIFTSKVNYRNHKKIVVIDGKVGFIGGMNLAERYLKGINSGIWRDTHLMIKGKATHGLQTSFLLDWYFVDRSLISSSEYFPKLSDDGNTTVQVVTSQPVGPWKEMLQGLTTAIENAKRYFYIQTPYFLPNESILLALQTAALSGIDVRLMLPERGDSWYTQKASYSYITDVLEAGVKVYFYKKGFLHSKMMVSDDEWGTVGSTNFDFRSFEHNFEANAFMYDTALAKQMRDVFLEDQRKSIIVNPKKWNKRSRLGKISESLIRLFAPLL